MKGNRRVGIGFALFGAVFAARTAHLWLATHADTSHRLAATLVLGLGIISMTTGVSLFKNPGRRDRKRHRNGD